ncbi:uncharacterized protein LOC130848222 [Hippopotamus amphibius kiboko]|uniref:uncharacterized protein LOC130848222 n=1 Tax=Hippopotamus amphibius kiboko TaxID=575201 RepID=UPI0025962416|nr:uncharacterized protein LOC130848222 [Hippopotamus amphibius kiboko]XP_057582386.1 uncharacterized protein LOC130848222 [Hippopotamus amphibius kiboko]XP_057582387.1 uncharacterized protein LOC130848222 [Hippopotamus amphibius kiboko]XP_057582388.1 uncharacterized protein LOC130848222 [Hippopotamus amphibius kiboko]XP_057582389.1 uncharacterized protein LOC130848222 [Hippopotamus amphibius kiboko]XP_057582390.1 uncharacterized protein LOC130848222 [Hippopotamus amphibius kiboko]
MLHHRVMICCCTQQGMDRNPASALNAESLWTCCLPSLGSSTSVRDTSCPSNKILDPKQKMDLLAPVLNRPGVMVSDESSSSILKLLADLSLHPLCLWGSLPHPQALGFPLSWQGKQSLPLHTTQTYRDDRAACQCSQPSKSRAPPLAHLALSAPSSQCSAWAWKAQIRGENPERQRTFSKAESCCCRQREWVWRVRRGANGVHALSSDTIHRVTGRNEIVHLVCPRPSSQSSLLVFHLATGRGGAEGRGLTGCQVWGLGSWWALAGERAQVRKEAAVPPFGDSGRSLKRSGQQAIRHAGLQLGDSVAGCVFMSLQNGDSSDVG